VKLHKREALVKDIEGLIGAHLLKLMVVGETYEKYLSAIIRQCTRWRIDPKDEIDKLFDQLTYGEMLCLVGREISVCGKYIVRSERHPDDPSRPGGLE
jgi:hypothetical protein